MSKVFVSRVVFSNRTAYVHIPRWLVGLMGLKCGSRVRLVLEVVKR